MKKSFAIFIALAAMAANAQPGNSTQETKLKAFVAPKRPLAPSMVKSQNQPIYLTLAPESKPQQSTGTNYTLIAAIIAALASLASAYISFKSKDKDFRNDYYKKLIDKRLSAHNNFEKIVSELSQVVDYRIKGKDDSMIEGQIFAIFSNSKSFGLFMSEIQNTLQTRFWLSKECIQDIGLLRNYLADVSSEFYDNTTKEFDEKKILKSGVKHHEQLNALRQSLVLLLRKEIIEVQNIDKFFEQLTD